jgi:hypothetical protein
VPAAIPAPVRGHWRGAAGVWALIVAAYLLWPVSADWLIVQTTALGRATGLPLLLAEPLASFLYLVRNFDGPALTVLGVVVSGVILAVTALLARLIGRAGRR